MHLMVNVNDFPILSHIHFVDYKRLQERLAPASFVLHSCNALHYKKNCQFKRLLNDLQNCSTAEMWVINVNLVDTRLLSHSLSVTHTSTHESVLKTETHHPTHICQLSMGKVV